MIQIRSLENQWVLPVRVTPRGGRDCILPFQEGDLSIRIKVSAPPEDGKANLAVIRLLADVLGVPKSALTVLRGQQSREKQIGISHAQSNGWMKRLSECIQAPVECKE